MKKGDIRIPPEGQMLGKKSPGLALSDSDAIIELDLPPSSVVDVTEKGRSGRRGHEAFVRKAIAEGKKVPKAIAEAYGLGDLEPAAAPVQPEPATIEEIQEPKPDAEPEEGDILMHAGLPPLRGTDRLSLSADATKRTLRKGAKAIYQGLIKTHGGKPEAAALMEDRARGEVEIQASRDKAASKAVKRAIKRHNKSGAEKITTKRLMAALTDTEAMKALPDSVRPQVEKMRKLSDDLSRTIVNEGMTGQTMSEVIEGRMGQYLRRAYKAHSDPKWAERVPQDVRNRLESLLVSWSAPMSKDMKKALQARAFAEGRPKTMEQREAHFELQSRRRLQGKSVDDIRAEMLAMLHDAQRVAENPWAAFAKSKLKRKDVSLFKPRKGLPVEMREYLGEEKNPYTAYTNTIIKQARLVATHRKFVEMRAEGIGKWLHDKPTVPCQRAVILICRLLPAIEPRHEFRTGGS